MRVNLLDAHDRLTEFQKLSESVSRQCAIIISSKPFGDHPFYIFAHARTAEDGINKRLIWQPRLFKPKAQPNSMLFRAYPRDPDKIKIIWMLPARELWEQYEKGYLTESQIVKESITAYKKDRNKLEFPENDEPTEDEARAIYKERMS